MSESAIIKAKKVVLPDSTELVSTKGGYRIVQSLAERNQLGPEYRQQGMLVYVIDDTNTYRLLPGYPLIGDTSAIDWEEVDLTGTNVIYPTAGTINPSSYYDHLIGYVNAFGSSKHITSLRVPSKAYGSELFISRDHTHPSGFSLTEYAILGDIDAPIELVITGNDIFLRVTNNEPNTLSYVFSNDLINLSGGSGHIIEGQSIPAPQRPTIDFVGAGVVVTDTGTKTQVAITGGGDVVSSSTSSNNAIVRFDGITGKIIQDSGIIIDDSNNISGAIRVSLRDIQFTPLSSPPLFATTGDTYYDSVLNCKMYYDGSRSKWLSADTVLYMVSRDSLLGAGISLQSNGVSLSSSPIQVGANDVCLIGINVTTSSAGNWTIGVKDIAPGGSGNLYTKIIDDGMGGSVLYSFDYSASVNQNFLAGDAIDVYIHSLGTSGNINRPVVQLLFKKRR